MRKSLAVTLITLGAVTLLPVALIATTAIVNSVSTRSELDAIETYGERIPVDGKEMNVVDSGTPGEAIVLLPGLGTAAPALDFQPLITELSRTHRVITVEPFGTGLSDQADTPRTAANIAREVHEAVDSLGVDRYVLMGHSIAGVYALEYSAQYGDELIAFVGIDSSVPGQPGAEDPTPTGGLSTLNDLGILRALSWISGDQFAGLPYDEAIRQQMRYLNTKNGTAPSILDEMERAPENFAALRDATFPSDLPILLFVVENDPEFPNWVELHEQQAESVTHGQVVPLQGEHYLHHTQSETIARDTQEFLSTLPTG